MTTERKEKIKNLRLKLANLPKDKRQIIANQYQIVNLSGHTLSPNNTVLLYLQNTNNIPTVVGGFNQWKAQGKIVKRGEHGSMIWFPVGNKNDNDEVMDVEKYFITTVFDISQVENMNTNQESKSNNSEKTLIPVTPIKTEAKQENNTQTNDKIMEGFRVI